MMRHTHTEQRTYNKFIYNSIKYVGLYLCMHIVYVVYVQHKYLYNVSYTFREIYKYIPFLYYVRVVQGWLIYIYRCSTLSNSIRVCVCILYIPTHIHISSCMSGNSNSFVIYEWIDLFICCFIYLLFIRCFWMFFMHRKYGIDYCIRSYVNSKLVYTFIFVFIEQKM